MSQRILLFLAVLTMAISVRAAVIRVPGDLPTIQEAIDRAVNWDHILVADGTYTGPGNKNLDTRGKALVLESENGADLCVIDCENSGRGFYIHSGEDENTVIRGFTVVHGDMETGGGACFYQSSPMIISCVFMLNNAVYGGGVEINSSEPVFVDSSFLANSATTYGGGAVCNGAPVFRRCTFAGNDAISGGGIHVDSGYPRFITTTFSENVAISGGAAFSYDSFLLFFNCLIRDNQASQGGGVLMYSGGSFHAAGRSSSDLINCTFSGNQASEGAAIYCGDEAWPDIINCIIRGDSPNAIYVHEYANPTVLYSNVQGGFAGEGNIDSEPLFVSGPAGDYYLSQLSSGQTQDSPCTNTGQHSAVDTCVIHDDITICLDDTSTKTDSFTDIGMADMGYHAPPGECSHSGDVTGDGEITSDDAQMTFQIALAFYVPDQTEKCAADCNGDAEVSSGDAQTVFSMVMGSGFCVDPPPVDGFVHIESGNFYMGSPGYELCRDMEETEHFVTLTTDFYMQKTEVTQEQWETVMGSNPSYFNGGNRPVENITWYDAVVYCNRYSLAQGISPCYYADPEFTELFDGEHPVVTGPVYWDQNSVGYRLPTEAEWEYTCRAGQKTAYNNGQTNLDCQEDANLSPIAWYYYTSGAETHDVGLLPSNLWGLVDMHGNVFEYCWDWYGGFSPSWPQTDPMGPDTGEMKILRGGGFISSAESCRSGTRPRYWPDHWTYITGLRLVRSIR